MVPVDRALRVSVSVCVFRTYMIGISRERMRFEPECAGGARVSHRRIVSSKVVCCGFKRPPRSISAKILHVAISQPMLDAPERRRSSCSTELRRARRHTILAAFQNEIRDRSETDREPRILKSLVLGEARGNNDRRSRTCVGRNGHYLSQGIGLLVKELIKDRGGRRSLVRRPQGENDRGN